MKDKRRHELKYIEEIGGKLNPIEILDTSLAKEELELTIAAAIRKLHIQVTSNNEFTKGEIGALERITLAYTKMTEDKRKEEEHLIKHQAQMGDDEIVKVLTESLKALTEEQREQILLGVFNKEEE